VLQAQIEDAVRVAAADAVGYRLCDWLVVRWLRALATWRRWTTRWR